MYLLRQVAGSNSSHRAKDETRPKGSFHPYLSSSSQFAHSFYCSERDGSCCSIDTPLAQLLLMVKLYFLTFYRLLHRSSNIGNQASNAGTSPRQTNRSFLRVLLPV
jgi:hypothetical protein